MDSHAAAAAPPPNETDSTATIHFKEVDEEEIQFSLLISLHPPFVCGRGQIDGNEGGGGGGGGFTTKQV